MSPPPSDSPTINIVVVQPTPFCNINCSYCYLPQRTDKTVMPQSTVRILFEQVFASRLGEPRAHRHLARGRAARGAARLL